MAIGLVFTGGLTLNVAAAQAAGLNDSYGHGWGSGSTGYIKDVANDGRFVSGWYGDNGGNQTSIVNKSGYNRTASGDVGFTVRSVKVCHSNPGVIAMTCSNWAPN